MEDSDSKLAAVTDNNMVQSALPATIMMQQQPLKGRQLAWHPRGAMTALTACKRPKEGMNRGRVRGSSGVVGMKGAKPSAATAKVLNMVAQGTTAASQGNREVVLRTAHDLKL